MNSYMCHTCNTEHDTIPQAMACFAGHQENTVYMAPPEDAVVEINPAGSWKTPLAPELLGRAAAHMHERAATYDDPEGERSMGKAVTAFNAITGHSLTESEGWLLLQVLKDVRLFTRKAYHADSAEDCIAYAALKAEAKGSGR
jgi:hypothetical protein